MGATKARGRKRAEDTATKSKAAVKDSLGDEEQVEEPDTEHEDDDQQSSKGSSDGSPTLVGELKDAIREAAVEVLKPVARKATLSAAKLAVTSAPALVSKVGPKITDKVEDAGGAGALMQGITDKGGDLASKLPFGGKDKDGKGKGGKKAATGTGRGRRLPVQEYVDVAVPIDVAYDQYTQFEEFPRFMHRVEKVEQRDDTTLMWHENVWGVRRQWEVEITDQTPNERIAWRSKDGQMVGVVTFHELSDRLTRVYVNMDFQPHGILEKSASGMRHSRRALASDLMRFKAYVEMKNDSTGAWRGRIDDGEVVDEQDEGREDDDRERDDEPRAEDERDEEYEDEEEDEPRAEEDDEYEDDEEEEQKPRSSRRSGRFSRGREEEDEEYEDEEDEEPVSEADEDEDAEEEEEAPKRKPRRRTPAKSGTRRK